MVSSLATPINQIPGLKHVLLLSFRENQAKMELLGLMEYQYGEASIILYIYIIYCMSYRLIMSCIISVCLSVSLPVCLSNYLFSCLLTCLSVCMTGRARGPRSHRSTWNRRFNGQLNSHT